MYSFFPQMGRETEAPFDYQAEIALARAQNEESLHTLHQSSAQVPVPRFSLPTPLPDGFPDPKASESREHDSVEHLYGELLLDGCELPPDFPLEVYIGIEMKFNAKITPGSCNLNPEVTSKHEWVVTIFLGTWANFDKGRVLMPLYLRLSPTAKDKYGYEFYHKLAFHRLTERFFRANRFPENKPDKWKSCTLMQPFKKRVIGPCEYSTIAVE